MRIYADQNKETLVASAGDNQAVESLTFRRSAASPLVVQFTQAGAIVDPGAPSLFFVLKTDGKYDEDPPILLNGSWTKTGTGNAAEWEASLNFVTTALDTLFAVDGDDTNDVASITLMGELVWIVGGVTRRTGRLEVTIENTVYRGDETPTEETASPGTYLKSADAEIPRVKPEFTGLAGGTATDLDSEATIGLPAGRLYILPNLTIGASVISKQWVLTAATDAEDAAQGIIRPDDYATSTNEKVWKAI